MPQRVYRHGHFRPTVVLVSVPARTLAALRRALQRPPSEEGRRGLRLASLRLAQYLTQVVDDSFKAARPHPALGLLMDHRPGWQIMGQHAPGGAGTHRPAQSIEHVAQRIGALRGIFRHQGQVGGHKGPFVITHVARISFSVHPLSLPRAAQSA